MSIDFPCPTCGRLLRAEEDQVGVSTQCPVCTAAASVPAPVTVLPPLRNPICPCCDSPMEANAVLCLECGYHSQMGEKLTTTAQRFQRYWPTDIPVLVRVIFLLCCWLVWLLAIGVFAIYSPWWAPLLLLLALLQGVWVGWYDTLHLERTRKGKLLLTTTGYIGFVPLIHKKVNLRKFRAVRIDHIIDGPLALLGGLFLMGPRHRSEHTWFEHTHQDRNYYTGRYRLVLVGKHDRGELVIYRCVREEVMREIVSTLQELGNLEVTR